VLCTLLLGVGALGAGAPAAHAQIAVGNAQASESAGSLTFTITREAGLLAPAATVAFATADGSATAPADYAAASGSRTFPGTLLPATQTQHVTVAIVGDALDEVDETFRLHISGAGVSDGEGIATIQDDDPPPVVRVVDAPPAAEGATALFTIALNRASGRSVGVSFATADGSAIAGQDYAARGGSLTIPAGSTAVALGVPLIDDTVDEPDETFQLRLNGPSAAALGDASATATILDDDLPPAAAAPPVAPAPAGPAPLPTIPVTGSGAPTNSGALPRLGVSAPRLRRPSTILVTVACPRASVRCRGRMTIFSRANRRSKIKALRRERRLARRNFNLRGGATRTLRMALSRRDRVLLKRAGRMKVRAYVLTTDAAGRSGVRRVNGVLISRTSHSG